ncbi:MAG TPA: hypothetical protein VNE86_01805 [Nitrososphaerales archaeon]|nr:hypothetical protein [Nitrososphaerales archaeon]
MQPSDEDREKPAWTLPKRTSTHGENLHISSFVLLKNSQGDSIVLLKAGSKHPIQFKRGKLLLPAKILNFGEDPWRVAVRLLGDQINGTENLKVNFVSMQSYLGAHWDIVFVYEAILLDEGKTLTANEPFVEAGFYKMSALPREQIAEDHLEVLDELGKVSNDH